MVQGVKLGIGPGEETLTDINLIRLHEGIRGFHVQKFTKSDESKNGADWEWWIGSEEERWLQLRIQAKRVSHTGIDYDQIGHLVNVRDGNGDVTSRIRQFDRLIYESKASGAIPFHVFFNGWERDRFMHSRRYFDSMAMTRRAANRPFYPLDAWDSGNWGCTICPTESVKTLFEDPTISELSSYIPDSLRSTNKYVPYYLGSSSPWSHIFGAQRGRDPVTVRDVAENIYTLLSGNRGHQLSDGRFEEMTHSVPSDEAAKLAFGYTYMEKSMATLERQKANRVAAEDYLNSIRDSNLFADANNEYNAGQPLINTQGVGYRIVLDLNPSVQ
jgi:hypothetical protein